MTIATIDPTTGETIRVYTELSPGEAALIVEIADNAFHSWRRTSFDERAALMRQAASILRAGADEYARLMAEEMGKPVRDGRAEAEKCAWVCDYYAENAGRFLAPEYVETDAQESFVTFQPLGVILAVMPWNFPFWQVFRFAAPALMAGNTAVLKHASNVPGCALAIEDIFRQAGFPEGVFRTLLVGSNQVDGIIEHPLVRAVTLTGSTPAGRAVAAKAGEMLKKTVLELGGSDAYVVLDDADLDHAVETCVSSRLINSGQSCIAAKRFIVTAKNREAFERRYVERMKRARVGNPLDEATEVGPQARADLRDDLQRQVEESVARGPACFSAARFPMGRAPSIRLPCSPASAAACPPTRKSYLVLWLRSSPLRMKKKRSAWPTIPCLGWAPRSSRRISSGAAGWRRSGSRPAPSSLTPLSALIPACLSAASKRAATAGSCPTTASRSS